MTQDPILITGVGRRIGLSLAQNFLSRGVPLIGTYRTERAALSSLREQGADLYRCDFQDEEQLRELALRIKQRYRRLRAIIHNASDWLSEGGSEADIEIFRRMMQVHVGAPYLLNLALSPLLQASEHDHADIIHVGDYVSQRGSSKHIAYAASKAAQDNLTFSFSAKLSPKVKVNSVAPALVMFNDDDDAAYRQKSLQKSLMRREAGLEEFQHAIDFLLSSSYVTGRVLPLDGGRHLR